MGEMYERGHVIDLITLPSHMGDAKVAEVGGRAYLADLTSAVPHNFAVSQYCRTIRGRALARRGAAAWQIAQTKFMDPMENPESVADELSRTLTQERSEDSMLALKSCL